MKHGYKFNTETKTRLSGKMSTHGADRFGLLVGIAVVIASISLLIFSLRF